MIKKIHPTLNKVYFINQYTLVHILSGSGLIQVDFKSYNDWQDKAIYLSKGQYIKFLSDDFVVRMIEFPDEIMFHSQDVRVLFKHLIALGYIDFAECNDCKKFLNNTVFNEELESIIDVSTKQWYWQNPFQANKDEYQLIFDAKEVIDNEFKNKLSSKELVSLINTNGLQAQTLVKDKVGLTLKGLFNQKKILEGKKELAFTNKSIKEVSYDLGYKDPAYFTRTFKTNTGLTPNDFKESFTYKQKDTFVEDVLALLKEYHTQERQLGFYADKMHLSVKTLNTKVKNRLQVSLGQLIRQQLTTTAKQLLLQGTSVKEAAFALGFEEAHHFSSFFKHYTGTTPQEHQNKKYK